MHPHKEQAIQQLRKAKSAHLKWRTFAQAMVSGVSIDETKAPVDHTACDFGVWYHSDGQAINDISDVFADLDEPHQLLHATYSNIYAAIEKNKLDLAISQLEGLERISSSLLSMIDICIEDIIHS